MTTTRVIRIALASALIAISLGADATGAPASKTKNIVLVHGALTDGSTWRGVYDILTKDGFLVRVVQQPLTGLADDVAATKRVIDQMEGPVVLVGHSYGGTIITVAGADPKVTALVYVAALQPEPVAAAAFDAPVTVAAWHEKATYGVIATDDLELSPALAHWMYERSGTKVTEIRGSHLVCVSQPRAVARVIEAAALASH